MISNILFGLAGGLVTASWGAFKDSPYEGFNPVSYVRSILLTATYYLGLSSILQGNNFFSSNFVVLFSAIALERLTQEYSKAFLRRSQRSSVYKIPQSFHYFGVVPSYPKRLVIGFALTCLSIGVMLYLFRQSFSGNEWIIPGLILAIIPTIGGAWKDAPIEGFEVAKFPRSFIIMFLSSAVLQNYTNNLLILILGSAGLERVIVEFYKTFVVLSTPGKFHPSVTHEAWIEKRWVFAASYFAAIALLVYLWE